MNRLGMTAVGLFLALNANPACASSCTGTLHALIISGVCDFGSYSITVLSFSTTGSTQANLLDALHINLTAAAPENGGAVDVTVSPADGPFQASKAPPGTAVSAQYHITYVISGSTALRTENLKVNGAAAGQPAYYAVTTTANGTPVAVNSAGRQSNSVNLSGNPSRLSVSEDIILNAASTGGAGTTPLATGFASIASVDNQFLSSARAARSKR